MIDPLRARGLAGLLGGPRWSPQKLAAYRDERLKALARHAHGNVAYYRRLFDAAGMHPRAIQSIADLAQLPITSKDDLQPLPAGQVIAKGCTRESLIVHRTSGSSGEPFSVWRTRFEETFLSAFRLRALLSYGMKLSDRRAAVVYSSPAGTWKAGPMPRPRWMRLGLLRREVVHCLLSPGEILEQLRRIGPQVLHGYPATLSWLADSVAAEDLRALNPRFVTMGGEAVTAENRDRLSSAFGAPAYRFYGADEFNLIGWECAKTGLYHVCDDSVIVELVRDQRAVAPGEEGEVVCTSLHSFAAPLIRYRLGDWAVAGESPCPCGAPYSTLKRVDGRALDLFELPDGRRLHPFATLAPLMDHAPWLRRYQVTQLALDRFEVLAISGTLHPGGAVELENMIREALGPGIQVTLRMVTSIPAEANGKYRAFRPLAAG